MATKTRNGINKTKLHVINRLTIDITTNVQVHQHQTINTDFKNCIIVKKFQNYKN